MPVPADPATVQLLATIASSFASVAGLGWWLSGRFRSVEKAAEAALEKHDEKDDGRHDENLGRFDRINERLARIETRTFNGR
jgi:hypothetical protein